MRLTSTGSVRSRRVSPLAGPDIGSGAPGAGAPSVRCGSNGTRGASADETERTLNRVVSLQVDIDAELGRFRFVFRRFADVCGRTGYRREHGIAERRRPVACALEGLEVGFDHAADA